MPRWTSRSSCKVWHLVFDILCFYRSCSSVYVSSYSLGKPSVWLDIDQREEAVCADESHDFVVGYRLNGFPHPQVAWYRSQSGKMTDNRTEYNSSHLTIKSVRGQDAGLYKIEVRNSLGSDEANFTLEVLQGTLYLTCFASQNDNKLFASDCNTTNTSRTAEAFLWWYHVITVILSAVTGSVITTVVCLLRRRSRSSREADRLDTSKRHVISSTSARQQEFETLSEMGGTIKPYATTHVSAVKAACKQGNVSVWTSTPCSAQSQASYRFLYAVDLQTRTKYLCPFITLHSRQISQFMIQCTVDMNVCRCPITFLYHQ